MSLNPKVAAVDPRVTIAKHASDSGHWYDEHANQIEYVDNADGTKQIRPTLRQARKLQLCRGITSIIGQSHRHDLEQWKIREGIKSALLTDRRRGIEHAPHFEDKEYIAEILEASKQITIDTADEGTRIHAAIQSHFQGEMVPDGYEHHVAGVVRCITNHIGSRDWEAEKPVVSKLGYGTKLDLLCGDWLLDTKSKDGDEATLQKMRPFESYEMQLAAGRAAWRNVLEMMAQAILIPPPQQCAILYVSRTHPGVAVFKAVPEEKLERAWIMFESLLRYTQAKDKYKPEWAA